MSRQTNFEVPFLYDVLRRSGQGHAHARFDWALRDVLYNVVKDRDMLGDVISTPRQRRRTSANGRQVLSKPHIMSGYKAIVFMIGSI